MAAKEEIEWIFKKLEAKYPEGFFHPSDLENGNPLVRLHTVTALYEYIKDENVCAVPSLIKALKNEDSYLPIHPTDEDKAVGKNVKLALVYLLGKIGSDNAPASKKETDYAAEARKGLIDFALRDKDMTVRKLAFDILEKIKTPDAEKALARVKKPRNEFSVNYMKDGFLTKAGLQVVGKEYVDRELTGSPNKDLQDEGVRIKDLRQRTKTAIKGMNNLLTITANVQRIARATLKVKYKR